MITTKIIKFFKSFRNRLILIISLVTVVSVLFISKFVLNKDSGEQNGTSGNSIVTSGDKKDISKPDAERIKAILSAGIDSVLMNFGIKKEWITEHSSDFNQKKNSKPADLNAELFVKNVLIPADLTSLEVNADITAYLKNLGLRSSVNEDILTKDIDLTVLKGDSASSDLPLARIIINHSDKVHRESSIICVIINNVNEYDTEDIEKYLLQKNEFSFVFPRNLDDIDLQNKLLQGKKDVIINLTAGGKDNYETDFNASMDDKTIHEKVKNFSVDFPTITSVILTKKDNNIPPQFINAVVNDLSNYRIKVIRDDELALLIQSQDNESNDKFSIFSKNLISKGNLSKSIITSVSVNTDDFDKFYNEILTLKKLGYKFYNFSEFSAKKEDFEKKEQLKQEKIKEEKQKLEIQKKKQEQKSTKKKSTDKKSADKKSADKKQTVKKKTDSKKTETKKTETKKKTDVKKK